MSIIEAIQHAESEHAVYFLLTAYLESLWLAENASGLLGSLRRVPIKGQTDVMELAKALAAQGKNADGEIVAEAAEIFRVASQRLDAARVGTGNTAS